MTVKTTLAIGTALLALATPAVAQQRPAPVGELVRQINIPYQQFTLKNGLRVVVSTDRKAPVVAVSVWYNVGSKFEPAGKTGFAHLFEHLMFNGSENAPGDFFGPLKEVGATDFNGTTYFDRTNYFETVPVGALPRALFLESDRMGYLTGAITQGVLDEQRGVVQNEKRQGDNQPYGMAQYKEVEGLFPANHPYGHTTIGSMADLDAASLQTVKDWFHDHYGPNNAVLVLAGDVDVATARPLVERYFGSIPRGPDSVVPAAPIPTLPATKTEVLKDRVAATLISRSWVVPGLNDPQSAALDVAAGVLGGLASSRLDTILVKQEKLAVQVNAENESFSQLGRFEVRVVVRPGVDPATVQTRLDQILADFLKNGPTADEVNRYVTSTVSRTIRGFESVGGFGGKAVALAEGELYSNDPGHYKKQLAELAGQTPASVTSAADRWLSRPAYSLTIEPGPRGDYAEAKVPPAVAVKAAPDQPAKGTRGDIPTSGAVSAIAFPAVRHSRLTNGIEVIYAQRAAVPITLATLSFDAGTAADVAGKLGTQRLMLSMMEQGTDKLNATEVAAAEERLGADVNTGSSLDRTTLTLVVPSANLSPAIDLFADITRRPAFADAEVARVRNEQLATIAQELTNPNALAGRAMPPLLYGRGAGYAKSTGAGDPAAVATLTPDDLRAFHATWLRPERAKIFVVSDRPLAEVQALLQRDFGDWRGSGASAAKPAAITTPAGPHILLIDRPDSPQSVIIGGVPNRLKGTQDLLPLTTANDALGGSFLGRLNMDLREDKHWSYGVQGTFRQAADAAPYIVAAPVQTDKTGASIAQLRSDFASFLGSQSMTPLEFDRAIQGSIRALPGSYETSDAVLDAMQRNDLFRRPDDYVTTLAARYRGFTRDQLMAAIKGAIDPARTIWVVVGNAATVKPQLDTLGMPIEVIPAAAVAGTPAQAAAAAAPK